MRLQPTSTLFCIFVAAVMTGVLASASYAFAEMDGYVVRPIWTRSPTAEDLRGLYPHKVHGVTANVALDCLINQDGKLFNCSVVYEDPGGLGFGNSTIELSKLFRMKVFDADGAPVAGRKLRLPVRWWSGLRP